MSVYRVIDVIGTSTQSWKTPRYLRLLTAS